MRDKEWVDDKGRRNGKGGKEQGGGGKLGEGF